VRKSIDYVRNQGFTYLESEEQKLSFFCNQLGIDKKILPHKRHSGAIKDQHADRYFVDKFPMFYHPGRMVKKLVPATALNNNSLLSTRR
jgi:hypothetical protein